MNDMSRDKSKRKSPSREKYERNNPVASFRMSKKLGDKAQEAKGKLGLSYRNIFETGLSLIEVKIRTEAEIRKEAYREGHFKGYTLAESIYKVTYPCSICKKVLEVTTEEEKKAIRRFMIDSGWGHAACHDRWNSSRHIIVIVERTNNDQSLLRS